MKLSKTMMTALAVLPGLVEAKGPVSAESLVSRYGIAFTPVVRALQRLRRAGLLVGVRGKAGGYKLARDPDSISVKEFFEAIEGPLFPVPEHGPETVKCAARFFRELVEREATLPCLADVTSHERSA